MATTVTTSTSVTASFGSRMTDVTSAGVDWAVSYNLANTRWEFRYSTDNGATWTENTTARITSSSPSAASFFIDYADRGFFAYADGSSRLRIMRTGATDTITSTSAWSELYVLASSGTESIDLVVCEDKSATGHILAAVYAKDGEIFKTALRMLDSFPTSYTSVDTATIDGLENAYNPGSMLAVDFKHTGDGKTATMSPDLFVAWHADNTADDIIFARLPYSAGVQTRWDTPSARRTIVAAGASDVPLCGVFDGSRFVMAFATTAAPTVVQWYERDAADTTTTNRTPPALGDGNITAMSMTVDAEGDIRLYVVGTTSDDVKRVTYDRSAGTFGSWTTIEASTATARTLSAQRGAQGDGINLVWTTGAGSPYTVLFERDLFNTAPLAPTWLTPVDGSAQDEAATLPVSWQFNDTPGDTQSAYALKRTISAVVTYYNAGAGTWSGSEVKNTSTTSGVTLPATWGADGESVAFAVKTWDSFDVEGVYGSTLTVTGSTKVNPALTAPTDAGTITTARVTATWTVAEQTAYRLRVLTSADVVLYDSSKVTSTATTLEAPVDLADGLTAAKVEVRTWNNDGLESSTDTHTFTVDYIEPATPTYTITTVPASGYIQVAITDPTPGGGQPTVTSHDVYVRVASGGRMDLERPVGGDGIRIAESITTPFRDYAAASGVDYEYRTLAKAANGTSKLGAWT